MMKRALIIGDTGGIGGAMAALLRAQGAEVTGLSRSRDGLDVTDAGSVAHHFGHLEGPYDLIFVATGALEISGAAPEKALRQMTASAMMDQFALNALGPALILQQATRLMPRDGRAVFAALSARVGSIGDNRLGGWISYRTAKAALNQILHTASVEIARSHRHAVVVALHPGTVDTDFTQKYAAHVQATPAEAAQNLLTVMNGLSPDDTGGFYDWSGARVPW